jgi:hypothetical protein
MNKFIPQAATEYTAKRLEEMRREMLEKMDKEQAAKKVPGPPINFLPCQIPAPGTTEHIQMYRHAVSPRAVSRDE